MEVNFTTFERLLAATRDVQGKTYAWFAKQGMSRKTVISIEHGGNYRMSSLFAYVKLLGCYVMLNNKVVKTYKGVGPQLMYWRDRFHVNRVEMSKLTGLSMDTLNTMEHGGDFTRKTLSKYGERLGVWLTLMIPYGVPSPFDSKKFTNLGSYILEGHGAEK